MRTDVAMLGYGLRRRKRGEIGGQLFRLVVAAIAVVNHHIAHHIEELA